MPTWSEKEYQDYCRRQKSASGLKSHNPPPSSKRSKYQNRRTEYNGKTYDSQREANRAAELQLLLRAGEIAGVQEQVTFMLAGGVKYRADFIILHWNGTFIVEDVKGVRTKEYAIKKKLMAERGLVIREV